MPTNDERGIVSKSKLTALANKIKAAAGESGSFTLDELAALDISGGGGGETIMLSATFDAGENKIFTTDSLDDLKQYLTVTATVDVTPYVLADDAYTLSGSLSAGSNTITVTWLDKTTTFTVSGVIAATDVTPSFASSVTDSSGTKHGYMSSDGTITVYNTISGTWKSVYHAITLETGVRYRLTADAELLTESSYAGCGFTTTSSAVIKVSFLPSETTKGRIVMDAVLSDNANFATSARLTLYCTGSTSAFGCVAFRNLKVIKYSAS